MLEALEQEEYILTHRLTPTGPIPTAHDPEGVYPYESFCETSRRPTIEKYRMVVLRNDHIQVTICPDLGGKVHSLILRRTGTETLFVPGVVRPVRILPRHFFIGGGIEVSFPISHTPVQLETVLHRVERAGDRIYVSCGERELRFGMQWTVEYSLGEQDDFLTQRTVFYNPGKRAHPWMSWSNAGVSAEDDTEFHFPQGNVLVHDSELRTMDWADGPRRQSDVARMTGFFWRDADGCAFGAYTPSLRAGLYHIADPSTMPGIKLWTDGCGRDERWVDQYTLDGRQCLEIQAGPLVDQSMKDALAPGQMRHHVEFWLPSTERRDIETIELPRPVLRDLTAVPLFEWARPRDVDLWLQVIDAARAVDPALLPPSPDLADNRWAPSGMGDDLGNALAWAAVAAQRNDESSRWLFHYGTWLAGINAIEEALAVLDQSSDDRARAFAGRLYLREKKDARTAVERFSAIENDAIALHPQVVCERDGALAQIGPETLGERGDWLDRVCKLDDEWLAERRALLCLDRGDAQAAFDILKSTPFQLVHQRYVRTGLWRRVEAALGLTPERYPFLLGEDDLADFGAYREYREDVG